KWFGSGSGDSEQLHLTTHTLETPRSGPGPVETPRIHDRVPRGLRDKHHSGTRGGGNSACKIYGTAEPVASSGDRAPRGEANPEARQVVRCGRVGQVEH